MGSHMLLIHLSFVLTCIYVSNGCQLEGVSNLPLPVSVSFLDTFRGTILNRTISEIEGINAISNAAGVNLGPYVDFILTTTHFAIVTNNAFENYEEFETSDTFSITVTFACTGSSTRSLVFVLNVIDTNNNAPRFTPSNEIEFTIAPPVPPGYVVTGCLNDIIARDIDLTTQRVEFTIEENPYFEIAYDAASSTTAKEFKATLRTTSLIRSFPEPVTLTITATDVDLTGDPPLTTAATLKIIGDTEFQFPEELVFSQAYYLANYTTDNQIAHGLITLEQGYDEQVQFILEGEYSSNFVLNRNGGQISLSVTSPVPTDVYVEKHILLVVRASREYTSGATTTIIVQLPEATILEFQRVHYEGNIINNTLQIPQINLTQGYADSSLTVFVRSEYSQYFMATLQGNVITLTMSPLSEGIIEDNNFIYLEIVASTDRSTASTIVTLEIIKDDNVTPVFNSPLYMGTYNATSGLSIEQIIIEQGYDETVYVHLEGVHASYFQLSQAGAVITLLAPTIPVDLYAEQHILLTIAATKPKTVGANAVIIITLPAARELRFDSETEYRGSLQDNEITLSPITLVEGYDDTVFFSLTGGLANYFTIMQIQNQVVIELATPLTDEILLTSNNIILTLTALGLNAVARSVTIVLDIIKQDTNTPVFSRNIYEGTYNTSFEVAAIYLSQGHDESVAFSIYGDHAQYFEVSNTGNNVHLSLQSTIPEELILNEKFLSFNILAEKNLTVGANAAVIIRFPLVLTEPAVMRFSQNNYVGTIQNNTVDIGTIILEVGYALETVFLLSGDYASYFSLLNNNNSVSVSLSSSLQNIPDDTNFIVLDLTAQRERAIPTVTTLIFEVIKEYIEPPIFGAPYYRGLYGEQTGLQFQEEIYLSEGHDETVTFLLDGDLSVWFSLVQYNATTLTLSSIAAVPVGILESNNQLLFTVIAIKPNANNARAVISLDVIKTEIVPPMFSQPYYIGSLTEESGLLFTDSISLSFGYDETVSLQLVGDDAQWFALQQNGINNFTITRLAVPNVENRNQLVFSVQANKTQTLPGEAAVIISFEDFYTQSPLTFTQDIYNGIIDNYNLTIIGEIRIQEGGAQNLTYSLNGDHSNYFQITNLDGLFILELSGQLPDDVTSANDILVFSLVVHNERTRTHATIILEFEKITDTVGHDDFEKPYYTGTYDETNGLVFTSTIFLSRGYDENVTFHLEGDEAQYFGLARSGNSLNLTLTSPIPAAVLANNRKLIFVVTAQRAGSTTARSTIVVSLIDEYTEGNVLGFDRVTYVGSIENNVATVQSITLSEGYNANVIFSLHGELANYFSVSNVGSVVTIALQSTIPEQAIPTSGVVILEIQASSPSTLPAYATVILEIITDDDSSAAVEISFAETYYTGTYTEQGGLTFTNAITLSEGYDDSVSFALDGDDAQYFGLVRSGNSLNLTLTSPIPAAVLANNRKLIFVVTAQRAGSTTARSTIVVSLIDEYTEGNVLGFDRVTYVGSIENNVATVQSITLSEGYNANVVFSLHGELANYFSVSNVGSVVTIALQSTIPEQAIPTSGVVILEIQASLPSTLPAYATVILEIITDDDSSAAVEISFAETYYTGTYTEQGGLAFTTAITLSEGYDDSVLFALDGDDAQYFGLVRSGNSLNLTLTSPIPAAVLANNRKLIFVVTAQRAGSTTARSTIVVSLIDEYTEGNVLGFDRVTYVGSIENNVATVQSITLSEGYNANVVFSLHGELANYFSVSNVGSVVTIALQSTIPEQAIPTSGVVILEIQASLPSTLPAYATVILEIITDDDSSAAVEISFAETYYTGTYTEQGGLAFTNAITLSEGYDDSVSFALDGDDAQYFGLVRSGNSLNLTLTSPIPAAVLANNRKLIFVVTAQRAGSTTARSTIVVSLIDEYTEGNVLGFDRVTYVGSIENNVATVQSITLSEGYNVNVVFSLHGELANYFSVSNVGSVVTIALQSTIPEQAIPTSGVVILEIQASLPSTLPAYATVILEIITDDDSSAAVEISFAETYYTGTYTEQGGLAFTNAITLSEGYDDSVSFALDGDDAQYFGLVRSGNSLNLTLTSPIPAAVLANNRKLIFVVTAQRAGSTTARSTIVVSLIDEYTEGNVLGFDRVTYVGSIENNVATVQSITLSEGYNANVVFSLHGELANYFSVSNVGSVVTIALQSTIPEEAIPTSGVVILEIQASLPSTLPAYATVILEIITDDDSSAAVEISFAETYYTGTYTEQGGLAFTNAITLSEGYDDSVSFALDGDDAQYFGLVRSGNSLNLTLTSPIPAAVLANNRKLIFVVTAQRAGSTTARSTIVVSLIDEYTEGNVLGFDRVTYVGSIENNVATVQSITLSEGYNANVVFSLHGELANYFSVSNVGSVVTIALQSTIPEQAIPTSGVVILEIQASLPSTLPAYATVILEIITDDDSSAAVEISFAETYYTGTYTEQGGLAFTNAITLSEGYDDSVSFALDGDDAQYFGLVRSGNSLNLTLTSPIPAAVLANNRKLIFVVTAQRAGSTTARSTIVISLIDEYTEGNVLGFDRVTYVGSIENNVATVQSITLSEGYNANVVFSLHGELANYFSVSNVGSVVTIALQSTIPEQAIPTSGVVILEIQASLPSTLPAYATVILEIITDYDSSAVVEISFAETYYTGTYTEQGGLAFTNAITLSEGYDDSVSFALDGDDAQYFGLVRSGNSLNLTLTSPIPAAVLANNRKLIFVVTAQRAGSTTARSTIVVSLIDEYTEGNVLGFDRVTYVGSIENNVATVQSITLSEGYNANVVFSLHGELANYFSVSNVGSVVTIALQSTIPEQAIPTSGVVILEIQASLPSTLPAYATVILEIITDDDSSAAVEISFAETYYTGTYTEQGGLAFTNAITLSEGYDDSVSFALDGDDAQYFGLVRSGNSLNLTLTSPIPAAVLANNRKLNFVVTAQRAGSTTARSTIVISLIDEYTEGNVLGFDRVTYVGSIENNVATVQSITLSEGYNANVVFSLHGELANYFSVSNVGSVVTIALQSTIPEQAIPTSGVVILEIQASLPSTLPAYATVILEIITDDDSSAAVEISFAETYYTGTYTEQGGLAFTNAITLSEGYDDSVSFALDGDDAQYFGLVRSGNSLNLTLTSPIPAAVLANNRKLIFVVTAQRAGSTTARSTIVISLIDEYTEGNVLGFDRVTYVGSIENNVATVQSITLSEGYNANVVFSLHGELANYFSVSNVGSVVTIALQSTIPEQAIPTSGVVILEIQASLPSTLPAYATVILEIITDDDSSAAVEISFAETYYTGTYTEQGGLAFTNAITLSEGYDDSVSFALDGDDAQYFGLVRSGNSLNLTLTSPIPAAVLANNRKLIFVVTAQRAGSTTARSTIVVSLIDEYTEGNVLGFDRVTYVGSIENNVATVQSITLSEGYNANVVFSLHGELANYFSVSNVGSVVTIALQSTIPEQAIPTSGVVILEIQASLPSTLPAYATVILEIITDDDSSAAVEISFAETYYTGTYTEQGGLAFTNAITLSEGYDDSVSFALDGDDAQYFGLVRSGNSLNLTLTSPIPAAVLANNRKLIFVVTAQRAGSTTARSTIVISLIDEYTEGNVFGFDRVTYVGSIENNVATVQSITLSEGYNANVVFSLHGELANYFSVSNVGSVVTIALQSTIPEQAIPTSGVVILEIQASLPSTLPAYATVILEIITDDDSSAAVEIFFAETYYTGTYTEQGGLTFTNAITLSEGYDESVSFYLDGVHSDLFILTGSGNSLVLVLLGTIPAEIIDINEYIILIVTARRPGSSAQATVIITLPGGTNEGIISFERILYEGIIQLGIVQHEPITISGYTGTNIQIFGEYSNAFVALLSNGVVTVQTGSVTLPAAVTHVTLELRAGGASAVLILTVLESAIPVLPSVTFGSVSYALQVEVDQTGLVGRVEATADNGETITYAVITDSAHLQTRLSISNGGELHLSAPVDIDVYNFQVMGSTTITQVSATAPVHLTVNAVTVCGDNNIVTPPLIILNRDEEESHNSLVVINGTQFQECRYSLVNRWPVDQSWLYVDETGLHTRAIDREHESIAFMAQSQVQVELTLHCESDQTNNRSRRSLDTPRLGPYDYGTKDWILSDTILYNSRRSLVNLIVNDINDNAPVFVGKENEPIAVGYPIPELEETILPRSLAELKATDADIGENAELRYWSTDPQLAVAPSTGFVHVRSGARLEHEARLIVLATDRNGDGLSGSIQLQVKLLDDRNIVVVTVRDAFLDDEEAIVREMSAAVGYEVKVLRSVVISDDVETINTRNNRDAIPAGASLQLYAYGLMEREPVEIEQLITDINNNAAVMVNVASILSLEDHLEGQEICVIPGRDTGLLVATIVLSILLFILIVLIVIWVFRKRLCRNKYEEFSDENSLASRNDSMAQLPKPEIMTKPRLDIEELKRSERRLQDMLNAPITESAIQPSTARMDPPVDAVVDMTQVDARAPIVIQSIDKLKDAEDDSEDEFGERPKPRRKSVVTFNENVEKIIHLDDNEDISPDPDYEVYKL